MCYWLHVIRCWRWRHVLCKYLHPLVVSCSHLMYLLFSSSLILALSITLFFTLVLRFTNKDVHEPCFLSFTPCSPWASPILLERCLIWGHHAFNCLCSCRNVHLSIKCCQSELKCSNPPQVTLTVGVRSQSSAPQRKGFLQRFLLIVCRGICLNEDFNLFLYCVVSGLFLCCAFVCVQYFVIIQFY